MCCNGGHCEAGKEKIRLLKNYLSTLHCPTRWEIISVIGKESKGTNDIYDELIARGEKLARSSLYYHLGELRNGGIVVVSGYREEGGGAPEKMWKLKTTEIHIDLFEDLK